MGLFVDDGVENRGHRANMWSPNYEITGIAFCEHNSAYNYMTDIVYAGGFVMN
jgi:uncharacterized protein YkwD